MARLLAGKPGFSAVGVREAPSQRVPPLLNRWWASWVISHVISAPPDEDGTPPTHAHALGRTGYHSVATVCCGYRVTDNKYYNTHERRYD